MHIVKNAFGCGELRARLRKPARAARSLLLPHFRSLGIVSAIAGANVLLGASGARAADTLTEAGVFAAVLGGSHVSSGVAPVSGIVPGAALELTQHVDRFRLHLEGIPTVSTGLGPRGTFGKTGASLALLNAVALVDVDARRRLRVGAGMQIVDLTNTDGTNGIRESVRVTSPLYVAAATLPLPRTQFVELQLSLAPNVRGSLHDIDRFGSNQPDTAEIGAEVDYAAGYGVRRGGVTYLLGLRGLSYHTRDATTGRLVDRNTGAGATVEVRFALGRGARR